MAKLSIEKMRKIYERFSEYIELPTKTDKNNGRIVREYCSRQSGINNRRIMEFHNSAVILIL